MGADSVRHGAYVCISAPRDAADALAAAPVADVAARYHLENEYAARDGHPERAIAFLRRVDSTPADVVDEGLSSAAGVVHVAANDSALVQAACAGIERLLDGIARVRTLRGTVQPTRYTGGAMHEFAYARQLTQRDGESMPNALLLPLLKLPAWWAKDWMERHTYFLPRYDEDGRMVNEGHALAAAPGIPVLMRRTYRSEETPRTADSYDFVTYFECADADVATFDIVCASLRDVQRNPEWRFVREGPTWRGRRLPSWSALWTA